MLQVTLHSALEHVQDMYGFDPRSLVAMRITIALVVLLDIHGRTSPLDDFLSLHAFYGPNGVWTREHAQTMNPDNAFVIHYGVNSVSGMKLLFAVEAAAALFMLVGKNTRFATFICWALSVGSHRRNDLIAHGGDKMMRSVLLWMCFMPVQPCTIDAGTFNVSSFRQLLFSKQPRQWLTFATVGLSIQLGLLYVFSTFHKSYISYVSTADAVKCILQFEGYTMMHPLAIAIAEYCPEVILKCLSRTTFFSELVFGTILCFPASAYPQRMRTIALVVLMLLQIGFKLLLALGTFQWIMLSAQIGCLPSYFWECLFVTDQGPEEVQGKSHESRLEETKRGESSLGRRTERGAQKDLNDDKESPAIVPGRSYGWCTETFALALLVLIVLSNINSMVKPGEDAFVTNSNAGNLMPEGGLMHDIEQLLGQKQIWNMFTFRSDMPVYTGRVVVIGTLTDNTKLNLFTLEPWKDSMMSISHEQYASWDHRWRTYYVTMLYEQTLNLVESNAWWQCHKYNELGYRVPTGLRLTNVTYYRVVINVERFHDYEHPKDSTRRHNATHEFLMTIPCIGKS